MRYRTSVLLLLLCIALVPGFAEQKPTAVAVLPFKNSTEDIRSDYLGKIAEALLMYDLSSVKSIQLVSREETDVLLREKKLALTGLFEGSSAAAGESTAAAELEALTSADYLLRGEFVHLGDELMFIAKLLRVSDGKATVFRERGTDENTIHRLSEKTVRALTGRSISFTTEDESRSIISMRNEEPGIIAVYSPLINAEIYIDGAFAGYTTGDPTVPFIADKLRPGPHTVRTHLSKNFGVIDLPQIHFHDWHTEVRVPPGKKVVVRDQSRHFNDLLYSLQWVSRNDESFSSKEELLSFSKEENFSFLNRKGETQKGRLSYLPYSQDALLINVQFNQLTRDFVIPLPQKGKVSSWEESFDLLDIEISIDARYNDWDLSYSIRRNDVYQGLHRQEY